ncbi:MAG: ATP-grasp domain-containing protein [Bdellovibrionota bacterium]
MHVLVIESFSTPLQLLKDARARNYEVSILRGLPDTLFQNSKLDPELAKYSDNIVVADIAQYSEFERAVIDIHSKKQINAIIALSEYSVEFASQTAEILNIPFTRASAVSMARNKFQSKELFKAKNRIRNARAQDVSSLKNTVLKFGFPCVVKPNRGAASLNAAILRSEEDLNAYLSKIQKTNIASELCGVVSSDFVVEEYHQGPMFSIEVAQLKNAVAILAVGRRFRAQNSEVIELGTLMPFLLEKNIRDDCEFFVLDLLKTLQIDLGIYHIEVILTQNGFRLIEINPRLMGGSLPTLYSKTHETNVYDLVFDIYCERNMPRLAKHAIFGMSFFLGAAGDSTLKKDLSFELDKEFKDCSLDFTLFVEPGSQVKAVASNHGYIGRILLFSENVEELFHTRDKVILKLEELLGVELCKPEGFQSE